MPQMGCCVCEREMGEGGKEGEFKMGEENVAPEFSPPILCVPMASWKFSRFLGWYPTAACESYLICAPCRCYQLEAHGDVGGRNVPCLDRAECSWT